MISGATFEVDRKKARLTELEEAAAKEGFWDSPEKAESFLKERKSLETFLAKWTDIAKTLEDLHAYLELGNEAEDVSLAAEIERYAETLAERLDDMEMERMLGGESDDRNAIVTIHPGAGGTETQEGEEAGIKSGTFLVAGDHPYGYLKAESGVHRLVRISPFDANKRRHTSFASVFVSPEIDDDVQIQINETDLKIDTLRSGGAGGQHLNKVESRGA